ncbi:MAG: hypothetical protein CMP84_16365 [Gammaproteobacteria bacterium]|nr:hypothetical protein [Gammaproteobacteria bacterium]MAC71761.1 hypothetical protein [Gammaproteobacteria bacterium]|tara:strand:- start:1773 stop:2330 length:558 start_codon:yes stop_codon:yes gene_type:complete
MTKLKSVNIQGKEYVEVSERLKHFRSNYIGYSLISEVVDINDTSITIKAIIYDDKQNPIASGIAQEVKGSSFINRTSYVENCETSAWGRALANFGIGIDAAVASYNEVANAITQQKQQKKEEVEQLMTPLTKTKMTKANYAVMKKSAENHRKEGKEWEEILVIMSEKVILDTKLVQNMKKEMYGK